MLGEYTYATIVAVVIALPLLLIDGVLTGVFNTNNNPIVWCEVDSILGYKAWSIPIEDFFYVFILLLLPMIIFEKTKGRAGSW